MQLEDPVDHFDRRNEVQVSSIGISSSGVRNSATTVIESIWVATRIHVQTQGSISQVVEHSSDCGTSGILPPTRNDQGVSGTTLSCVSTERRQVLPHLAPQDWAINMLLRSFHGSVLPWNAPRCRSFPFSH